MIPIPLLVSHHLQAFGAAKGFFTFQLSKQLCLFQIHEILTLQLTLIKQYGFFKSVHFPKKLGCPSSAGPEILAFSSHMLGEYSTNLDCFVPNVKLKYEDSENIKSDLV